MQRRRSTPAGISTLRWALTCAIGAVAVGALVAAHVFLLPSAAVPDAFKLPKASPPPLFVFFWLLYVAPNLNIPTFLAFLILERRLGDDFLILFCDIWPPTPVINVRLDTGERLTSSAGPRKSRIPNSPSFGFPLRR
ncbi:unnamed protein product [Musa acuminata subsp. burmannicoides]